MDYIYTFMQKILPFSWAGYKFMLNALLAVLIIAPVYGLVGTMVVNNRMAFFSDALGHSAMTGIAVGVLLGLKSPVLSTIVFAILFALAFRGKGVSTAGGYHNQRFPRRRWLWGLPFCQGRELQGTRIF